VKSPLIASALNGRPAPLSFGKNMSACHDETIRSMIRAENELLNYRTTWLATLHGLLFAALGFAWDKKGSEALITVFCVLGVAISVLSLLGFVSGSLAVYRLYEWWEKHRPADYEGPDVVGLPPRTRWANPWNALPLGFCLAWVALACINWAHRATP
jgi:hypothetical protein